MFDQTQTILEGVANAADSVSQGEIIFTKRARVINEAWTKIITNYRLIHFISSQHMAACRSNDASDESSHNTTSSDYTNGESISSRT